VINELDVDSAEESDESLNNIDQLQENTLSNKSKKQAKVLIEDKKNENNMAKTILNMPKTKGENVFHREIFHSVKFVN
jgi:hypothetical protein